MKNSLFEHDGMPCQYCGTKNEPRKWIGSMTAYASDLEFDHPDYPNRPVYVCATCEQEYTEYWQSMWDDYHSSVY